MKKEIYKGVTIEYTKVVRTVFGITKVFAYDLKLTTSLDRVNNMSRYCYRSSALRASFLAGQRRWDGDYSHVQRGRVLYEVHS